MPISSGGIGEAMMRSASAMAEANNTIDESIALIVAANQCYPRSRCRRYNVEDGFYAYSWCEDGA